MDRLKINFKISLIVFTLSFLFFPWFSEGAAIYLMPQSQNIYQGDYFIVEVRINTEDEEINAAEISLTFPRDLLEAVDFSKGNSILQLFATEPKIQEGEISFLGGVPGGFNGEGLLAKINFLGKEIGKSEISFKEDSQVLLNDGQGTPAELSFSEGNYEIIKKPEGLPPISSRTHPDQNKWFQKKTLHLHWDLIEGAQYSYLLSYDPLAEPDESPEKPEGELIWMGDMEYEGLDDGIYYFSLKQKLPDEDWSLPLSYRAMIDTTPPEAFILEIGQDPSLFEGKYFLSFATQDKMSGIDYYEIKEGKRDFKKATSPYLLEDQSLGKKVIVRAFDKAGNYQEAEIKPSYKMTWQDGLYLILILVGMGVIGWILKKK
jgi:hypothetical protein